MVDEEKSLNGRLFKLKAAKKFAYTKSRSKKVLESAEELVEDYDDKIVNYAESRFLINRIKRARIKQIGKKREEALRIINELKERKKFQKSMGEMAKGVGNVASSISNKTSLIIDKLFLKGDYKGKNPNEILEMIGFKTGFVFDKDEGYISKDQQQKNIEKSAKDAEEARKKEIGYIYKDSIAQAKDNRLQTEKSNKFKNKFSQPLKIKVNMDAINDAKIDEVNENIMDHLYAIGEVDSANFISSLYTKNIKDDVTNISDIQNHTKAITRLSIVNSKINETLKEIEENMIDEQDTSIPIPQKLQSIAAQQSAPDIPIKEKSGNFLTDILKKLFGGWLGKLLSGSKSLIGFATAILGAGWAFLRNGITSLIKGAISGVMSTVRGMIALAIKPFQALLKGAGIAIEGAKKIGGKLFSGTKDLLGIGDKVDDTTKMSKNMKDVEASKKPTKEIKKMPSKGSLIKKIGKFSKVIPFIGTAIAVGTAAYSAVDGYQNASEILGKDNDSLTMRDRLAAAAGSLVNDATFGIIDASTIANKLIETPDKQEKNIDLVKINELSSIMTSIEMLKKDLGDAWVEGDEAKQLKLLKNIEDKQDELTRLREENQDIEIAEKIIISKDGSIQMSEEMYRSVIGNTKKYDRSRMISVNAGSGQNININSIQGAGEQSNYRGLDVFAYR